MEVKKTGKLNILGSGVAFLITVFIGVIYILLMAGSEAGNLAHEITTDYAGYWALPFVVCILMYLCCLTNIVAIPAYYALKSKNSSSPAKKATGIAQIVASAVMLVLVIIFWSWQGGIFNGDASTPFATQYRILELIFAIAQIGLIVLTMAYSPRSDTLSQLKKKQRKASKN